MFAQAILNIWNGTSVSSLFDTDTLVPIYEGMYSRVRDRRGACEHAPYRASASDQDACPCIRIIHRQTGVRRSCRTRTRPRRTEPVAGKRSTRSVPREALHLSMSWTQLSRQVLVLRQLPCGQRARLIDHRRPASSRSVLDRVALSARIETLVAGDLGEAAGHAEGRSRRRAIHPQDAGAQRGDGGRVVRHRRQVARRARDLDLGRLTPRQACARG